MYQDNKDSKKAIDNDNSWTYRLRLRADAKVNDNTTVRYGISTANTGFDENTAASADDSNPYTDRAEVVTKLGNNVTASVGRTDAYVLGNAYGYNYGDVFDRAQLKYANDSFAVTAGYGKFKEGDIAGSEKNKVNGVKTGYGEIEGFFGKNAAVGVYYNGFNATAGNVDYTSTSELDDLWGAYASVNFGSKWNALANYENVNYNEKIAKADNDDNANVWIGKLTYGKATMAAPKSWDAWVEYINAEKGAFIYGSSNSWRTLRLLDNVESWGVGVDYTFAKNAQFNVFQSFASSAKTGDDPEELTRAQFVFAF